MKIQILLFNFLIFIFFFISEVQSQTKYALLIGVNDYISSDTSKNHPPLAHTYIKKLTCAVNDVNAINEIIKARYDFNSENIVTLLNKEATSDEIQLALFDMIERCQKGDVFFFYFAGHGSQIKNTLSAEPDKMDETIVPVDGLYKGKEIRDKQIAVILQSFINKGILVTSIMECCHSGSMARGMDFEIQKIEASKESIADDKVYPKPEKNGALILGACQDFQEEKARLFPYPDGPRYSLFTKAFMEVMKKNDANISARDLINAINVQYKNWGDPLVASIAGNDERLNQPIFGGVNASSGSNHIVVQKIMPDKSIILQGGSVLGLEEGVELTNENKTLKIEIVKSDLSSSTAKVILGNPLDVKSGSFFSISRYAYSGQNKLQVCAPMLSMKRKEFFQLINQLNQMIVTKNLIQVNEINAPVTYWLYFNNSQWYLHEGKNETALGSKLNINSLSNLIQSGKTIRVQLPVYAIMFNNIKSVIDEQYSCVNISPMENSDYTLSGTLVNHDLNYKLLKTNADTSCSNEYPLQSDFYLIDTTLENKTSIKICADLYKLSRIKSWLNIESGNDEAKFPYSLVLKNSATKEYLQSGNVMVGDNYQLCLQQDAGIKNPDSIQQRYIYVFAIGSDGSIVLLYPNHAGNIENYFPINRKDLIEEIPVIINVDPPSGINHIFFLTSFEAITNPQMISQQGISTKSGTLNPLEVLINNMNAKTRSVETIKAPDQWSIQKIKLNIVAD